jgi:hypothetical protein
MVFDGMEFPALYGKAVERTTLRGGKCGCHFNTLNNEIEKWLSATICTATDMVIRSTIVKSEVNHLPSTLAGYSTFCLSFREFRSDLPHIITEVMKILYIGVCSCPAFPIPYWDPADTSHDRS